MTTEPVYTFGYTFGRRHNDSVLRKADGTEVATIGIRDGYAGVNVKVRRWGTDASKAKREAMPYHALNEITERISLGFWEMSIDRIAEEHGLSKPLAAGRSDGWVVVPEDGLIEAVDAYIRGKQEDELRELAVRFFRFAEDIAGEVEQLRTTFFDELVADWRPVEPPSPMTIYRDQQTGFEVEIDGEYGEESGSVYLRDAHGEIVSWTNEEWEAEPSLVAKILHAMASGFTQGPEPLRAWMNKPAATSIRQRGSRSDD